ncbi:unnamed protein product [marine sediment metagenome]|uniref:Uncharacterized protein n=1 Tax=marine sediment metagenome TaxID=412755 RepID=X1GK91_9ZZZZ
MQIPVAEEGALVNPAWFGSFDLMNTGNIAFNAGKTLIWDFFIDGAYTEKKNQRSNGHIMRCQDYR